jgi:hypothetical protein
MLAAALAALGAPAVAGCVANSGLIIILQNQQPEMDATTHLCGPVTMAATAIGAGVLDLEVPSMGQPPGYRAYPLVQSSLPPRADTTAGTDPNTVSIDGVKVTLHEPPGLTVDWPAGCPGTLFAPGAGALLPGTTIGMTAQLISPCQAQVIHDLFASGALPSDFSQQIVFTAEMRVTGRLVSGDDISSDPFRFAIRTCIGCLQTGFADAAQFDWPSRPPCNIAPKPNVYHGNPCGLDIAQDFGPLLCCTNDMSQAVCPAPDM